MNRIRPITVAAALVSSMTLAVAQGTLYYEPFEPGAPWSLSNLAVIDGQLPPSVSGRVSGDTALALLDSTWHASSVIFVTATSPPIDLTGSLEPQLTFWTAFQHEGGCQWDANVLTITREADGSIVHTECLSSTEPDTRERWAQVRRDLDPAWGVVRLTFSYDPIDGWNFNDWGYVVDDIRITDGRCGASTLCVPLPMADQSPGPTLAATGELSTTSTDMRIVGSGFVPHTFAAGFIGPETAILPIGMGTRCIAGNGTSRRLPVAPTRDNGTPIWTLDPADPVYGMLMQAGQPFFVQSMYRDGASVNFSEGLRIDLCQ